MEFPILPAFRLDNCATVRYIKDSIASDSRHILLPGTERKPLRLNFMALSRIVPLILTLVFLGLGVGAEIPHHHHDHEDETHAETCDQICASVHFQITGMTASYVQVVHAPESDPVHSTYQLSLPLPPLFPIDRPPKAFLS